MRTSTKIEIFAGASAIGTGATLAGQWWLVAGVFATYVLWSCARTLIDHRGRTQ